ncbi:MAG TPA: hypothetical protein VGC72_18505 [Candidatus Elarobacter sp.]|jgi:hypothetical protein
MGFKRRFIAAACIAAGSMCAPSAAASLEPVTYEVCGGAAQLVAVAGALVPPKSRRSEAALRPLMSSDVHISGSGGNFLVEGAGARQVVSVPPGVGPKACSVTGDDTKKVQSGDGISGISLIALQAAVEYRSLHPWPLGAANTDDPNASANVQIRGRYAFVFLSNFTPHELGCAGVEYYRVDPATLDVRPFDGCIEGHRPRPDLPGLRQLPE